MPFPEIRLEPWHCRVRIFLHRSFYWRLREVWFGPIHVTLQNALLSEPEWPVNITELLFKHCFLHHSNVLKITAYLIIKIHLEKLWIDQGLFSPVCSHKYLHKYILYLVNLWIDLDQGLFSPVCSHRCLHKCIQVLSRDQVGKN